MAHALRVVTPPAEGALLISLEDAKTHLRVDFDDHDQLITSLIQAAGDLVDDMTQRRYFSQTLEWILDRWRGDLVLPIAANGGFANIAVTAVNYYDLSGTAQVLDPTMYWLRPHGATLKLIPRWYVIWPWLGDAAARVSVEIAISVDAVAIPGQVQHAARLLVSHWYNNLDAVVGVDNRDSSGPLPFGVEQLLVGQRWG